MSGTLTLEGSYPDPPLRKSCPHNFRNRDACPRCNPVLLPHVDANPDQPDQP
jgi:hypothetical protein